MDTTPTTFSLQSFILSHLLWVVLIGSSLIGFHEWSIEHDARVLAEQQIKTSQAQVVTLQQQIADRDKQTQTAVAPIVKIIHDTVTVPQAVAALPQVVNQPLPQPVIAQPDNSVTIPEPDVIPLFNQVADDKVCRVQIDALTKDYNDQKTIDTQKDQQIAVLKKKPSFWHRVGSTMKKVGIGVGIGLAAAKFI